MLSNFNKKEVLIYLFMSLILNWEINDLFLILGKNRYFSIKCIKKNKNSHRQMLFFRFLF